MRRISASTNLRSAGLAFAQQAQPGSERQHPADENMRAHLAPGRRHLALGLPQLVVEERMRHARGDRGVGAPVVPRHADADGEPLPYAVATARRDDGATLDGIVNRHALGFRVKRHVEVIAEAGIASEIDDAISRFDRIAAPQSLITVEGSSRRKMPGRHTVNCGAGE